MTKLSRQRGQFQVNIKGISISVDLVLFGRLEFDFIGTIFSTSTNWRVIGEVSAQKDIFDFNKSNRPLLVELMVAIAAKTTQKISPNRVPYDIHFAGVRKITSNGSWKDFP